MVLNWHLKGCIFIEAFSKLSIAQMAGMVISVYASSGMAMLAAGLAMMGNPLSPEQLNS